MQDVRETMHLVMSVLGMMGSITSSLAMARSAVLLATASTLNPSTSSVGSGFCSLEHGAHTCDDDGAKTAE